MHKYVLIAGVFQILDTPFSGDAHLDASVFGAVFEMHEPMAKRAILEGAALLPQAMFDDLGFSAEEIAKYPNARLQQQAPDAWKAKHLAARIALHNYRDELAGEVNNHAAV